MKTFEKVLLGIALLVAFLGIVHLIPNVVSVILIIAIVIYLFAGWYILFPANTAGGKRWLPFMVSYLIAQTLLAILFGVNAWPMKELFTYVTMGMIFMALVGLLIAKKSISNEYPLNNYFLRLFLCLLFSGAPLWMNF